MEVNQVLREDPCTKSSLLIMDRYRLIKKIGKGSFSSVYQGLDTLENKFVAIKKIKCSNLKPKIIKYFENEIEIMKRCYHPNIITLYESVRIHQRIYLIMEFCEKGDLSCILRKKKQPEETVRKYMKHLFLGLRYLEKKGIIHRDLKPQNILLNNEGILKIIDFGFAKYTGDDLSTTMCGSPLYMAPEVLYHKGYCNKADLWSLGIIMYQMINGSTPFKAENLQELIGYMKHNDIPWPKDISYSCLTLLQGLLQKDAKKRVTWESLERHSWFTLPNTPDQVFEPMDDVDDIFVMEEDYIEHPTLYDMTNKDTSTDVRNRNDSRDSDNQDKGGDEEVDNFSVESSVGSINSLSGYPSSIYSDKSTQQLYNDFVLIPKNNHIREESNNGNESDRNGSDTSKSIISVVSRSLSSSYQTLRQNIDYFASSI